MSKGRRFPPVLERSNVKGHVSVRATRGIDRLAKEDRRRTAREDRILEIARTLVLVIDGDPETLLNDPLFHEELKMIRAAEQKHRQWGIDVRKFFPRPVTHPVLIAWLEQSDARVDYLPGRSDLRKKRRRGVLRMLDGVDCGLPLDLPPLARLPFEEVAFLELRTFVAREELEFVLIRFRPCQHPAVPTRPIADLLTHQQVRALLGWPASTLDYWVNVAPPFRWGLRKVAISSEVRARLDERAAKKGRPVLRPRDTLHRVVWETMPFMLWLSSNQN